MIVVLFFMRIISVVQACLTRQVYLNAVMGIVLCKRLRRDDISSG